MPKPIADKENGRCRMNLFYLVVAVLLLFIGHIIRTIRWRFILLQSGIAISNFRPLIAITLGYIFNIFLPFRIGELMRAIYMWRTTGESFFTIAASILFERSFDIFIIVFISFLLFNVNDQTFVNSFFMLFYLLFFIIFFILLMRVKTLRKLVFLCASIFNDKIKIGVLNFFIQTWYFLFNRNLLGNWKFWCLSCLMWVAYLTSVICLSISLKQGFHFVYQEIYNENFFSHKYVWLTENNVSFFLYMILPLIMTLGYAIIFRKARFTSNMVKFLTNTQTLSFKDINLHSPKFLSEEYYGNYLKHKFLSNNSSIFSFEDSAIQDVTVHRLFDGGSGAITALVEKNDGIYVRKYAASTLAEKLITQQKWIENNKSFLPIVKIVSTKTLKGGYLYDMEYISGSRSLFEVVHNETLNDAYKLIDNVLEKLNIFHQKNTILPADDSVIGNYITEKVCKNLSEIKKNMPYLFEYETLNINGILFSNSDFERFTNPDWLIGQFKNRQQTFIHGDLTLENILVMPKTADGWFLIDPNPENIFQSPLIDYAKLFQSLHFGYEYLIHDIDSSYSSGYFKIPFKRSQRYTELFNYICTHINTDSSENLREILLHEIVNYFRLIPYQFKKSQQAGLMFFGVLCLLINSYNQKYEIKN